MEQTASISSTSTRPLLDSRSVRILAKSVYRELKNGGHDRSEIVAFTNAMLELVTSELESNE